MNIFSRTELLYSEKEMDQIETAHIAVFGVGGVGGHCIETLVRSGISHISIFDYDRISLTNINRQIIALHSTINHKKVDVMKSRLLDINPLVNIVTYDIFLDNQTIETINFNQFDYIVDAIDTVSAKLLLIEKAKASSIPIISSMGTGNKKDATKLQIMNISETNYCPLAKVMRKELKKRNINTLKVISSHEKAMKPRNSSEKTNKRSIPGSTSFVPSVAGILITSEIIRELTQQ